MDFQLTCLGSAAAGPSPTRWASAQHLRVGKVGFLFDCAEGTQIALKSVGVGWGSIDYILISHLHGDHIYGLPGLLTSWGLNQRRRKLTIIGPAGLEAWVQHTLELSTATLPYEVEWILSDPTSAPATLIETKYWTLSTLPLVHRIPSQGYLLQEQPRPRNIIPECIETYQIPYSEIRAVKAGADFVTAAGQRIPNAQLTTDPGPPRSFAYCSDTAYHPALIPLLKGVDLVYHEATFMHELLAQAEYTGHTTAAQAAQLAREAEVGQLVIGHFSVRYMNLNPLLAEAKAIFPNTTLAALGKVVSVPLTARTG